MMDSLSQKGKNEDFIQKFGLGNAEKWEKEYSTAVLRWSWSSCKIYVKKSWTKIFTNSETAATTLWERLQNFQRAQNQWSEEIVEQTVSWYISSPMYVN